MIKPIFANNHYGWTFNITTRAREHTGLGSESESYFTHYKALFDRYGGQIHGLSKTKALKHHHYQQMRRIRALCDTQARTIAIELRNK